MEVYSFPGCQFIQTILSIATSVYRDYDKYASCSEQLQNSFAFTKKNVKIDLEEFVSKTALDRYETYLFRHPAERKIYCV